MSAMDVPIGHPKAASPPAAAAKSRARPVPFISWVALALMTTSSVASLRPDPTKAVYGLAAAFLYNVTSAKFTR